MQRNVSCLSRRLYSVLTAGPQGVEGRLPSTFSKSDKFASNTSMVITDPFVIYQGYVQLGKLERDEPQLRAMKEFQKLYYRVVDYKPDSELAVRTSLLLRKLEILQAEEQKQLLSLRDEPLHKLRLWFRKDVNAQRKELVRYLTDEEELHNIAAPHGLLVNGEVGCGKSMLMDIFASSLPHHSKMRWHYNNFILWVFGEIHRIQKERMLTASVYGKHKMTMENEFILFEVAQKMIARSTVFMLDEFMLPDVASAQIVRILFTYYFKLGGVLVATSNKLPEELYSSGFNKSRFNSFVGILNSRCVAVDMKSNLDYRHRFAQVSSKTQNMVVKEGNPNHRREWNRLIKQDALGMSPDSPLMDPNIKIDQLPSSPGQILVYNRVSEIPKTFKNNTVCYVTYDHICKGLFSSSDYITLASTYKVVIIDEVPVMTTKMKNEARRFITLLDALYEARCQCFLRCEVELERLFFPKEQETQIDSELVQAEEMFAKTAMQTLNPYRPNVSSYDLEYAKEYNNDEDAKLANANFGEVKAFTGEDEKFAYKRAVSRIKEMVGSDHWRSSDRWIPIDDTMRPWENPRQVANASAAGHNPDLDGLSVLVKDVKLSLQGALPRDVSKEYNVPFRQFNRKVAPAFSSLQHFWGIGEWTLGQQQKIKDKIAQTWVSAGIRNRD